MACFQRRGKAHAWIAGRSYQTVYCWISLPVLLSFEKNSLFQSKTIIILSIINFSLSNGLSTWGVKYITSGLDSIIPAMVPLWILLISIFKRERITKLVILGILICFGGVCLIFGEPLTTAIIFSESITLLGLYLINYSMRKK